MGDALLEPSAIVAGQTCTVVDTFEVRNPATEAVIGRAPACGQEEADAALAAAAAWPAWRSDPDRRASCLRTAADRIESDAARLTATLTAKQGKPLGQAAREAGGLAAHLRYYASLGERSQVLHDGTTRRSRSTAVRSGLLPCSLRGTSP